MDENLLRERMDYLFPTCSELAPIVDAISQVVCLPTSAAIMMLNCRFYEN